MHTRSTLLLVALAAVGVARGTSPAQPAKPTSFIKPPAGWTADNAQAAELAAKTNALSHFGGVPALATAEVFVAQNRAPAVLHVTAIAGKVKPDQRDSAARLEVDSFLEAPRRAQLVSAKVVVSRREEKVDPADKLVRAQLEWADQDAGTTTHAVLRIAATGDDSMLAVTAECVWGSGAPPAEITACTQALATIDPGIPADKRVTLALAPAVATPAEGGSDSVEEPPAPGASPTARLPATLSDGSRTPLPPMVVQHETRRTVDRRPVYVGLGIIVLAALFWWNRRRRERFDDKEETDE